MLNGLRKLYQLTHRFPNDDGVRQLYQLLPTLPTKDGAGLGARVLVQCVQSSYFLALFTHIVHALRQRAPIEVDLFVPRSFDAAVGTGWQFDLLRAFPINRLHANQWIHIYDKVATRLGYRSTSLRHPLGDLIDAFRSWRLWRCLDSTSELEAVSIGGVLCGDLVIDSYLRFRPSPRVQLGDLFLLRVLWQAHRDVRRAQHYFMTARPLLYLTSYTTYVQHGVAARVALKEGVRVYSFGNLQDFGKKLGPQDSFHTRDALNYKRDFEQLVDVDSLLIEAQRQLDLRMSGGVDTATSYMAASAYTETTQEVPDVRDAVVVFLHDFYDSPHVYPDLVFPDFWGWICFTIDVLRAAGIRTFVKPHPNQIALGGAVIDELLVKFPWLDLISPDVTNRQLVEAGMSCAVTVYGTVAHEMAYLGVPTIACARHPHVAFDFCRTARSRTEYAALLRSALAPSVNRDKFREQALQFFVMHNLSLPPAQIELRDALVKCWKMYIDPRPNVTEFAVCFENLASLPGFAVFVDGLLDGLILPTAPNFTDQVE